MRVLFLSQLFDPENSIKGLEFSRILVSKGYSVDVVTAFPSYPGGVVYRGFRQSAWQKTVIDGVQIIRVLTYISSKKSSLNRILGYCSFGLSAFLYIIFNRNKYDVIYAYYPPVVVGFLAGLISKIQKIPFIYDVQDLWPDALIATGVVRPGSPIIKIVNILCNWIYRHAAAIVVLSDGYKKSLIERKVPAEKIHRIFNWCDESRLVPATCIGPVNELNSKLTFLYAGNLGAAQALEHLLDAAEIIQNKKLSIDVKLVLMGGGIQVDYLKKIAVEKKLNNVEFKPAVSVDQVGQYLIEADVLVVHLAKMPVFEMTIPQKTQAYMYSGKPILMAVNGEAADLIIQSRGGVATEACNSQAIAESIIEMAMLPKAQLLAMGNNGKQYYDDQMSMSRGINEICRLLEQVIA